MLDASILSSMKRTLIFDNPSLFIIQHNHGKQSPFFMSAQNEGLCYTLIFFLTRQPSVLGLLAWFWILEIHNGLPTGRPHACCGIIEGGIGDSLCVMWVICRYYCRPYSVWSFTLDARGL